MKAPRYGLTRIARKLKRRYGWWRKCLSLFHVSCNLDLIEFLKMHWKIYFLDLVILQSLIPHKAPQSYWSLTRNQNRSTMDYSKVSADTHHRIDSRIFFAPWNSSNAGFIHIELQKLCEHSCAAALTNSDCFWVELSSFRDRKRMLGNMFATRCHFHSNYLQTISLLFCLSCRLLQSEFVFIEVFLTRL